MRGLNRIVIVGRLGADPELKMGKSGASWCVLSVATGRSQKRGEVWIEETDWHDVRVFGDDAERCQERLRKGSVVAVEGSLIYDAWTDEQGHRRRSPRIAASRIQFVADSKSKGKTNGAEPEADPTMDVPSGA